MGEGEGPRIIPPSEIGVEPETVVKSEGLNSRVVGGEYVNPSMNPEGVHLIKVDSLAEGSQTLELFGKLESRFDEEAGDESFLPMLSTEEKQKVSSRIGTIANKLTSDPDYRQDLQRLLRVHEMAHRTQEIRFKTRENASKESAAFENLPEGNEGNILVNEYYKTAGLIGVYDEADAMVSGLVSAVDIPKEIKTDLSFMSSAATWGQYGEKNKDGSQAKFVFGASRKGVIPAYMPQNELAALVVESGDVELPLKLKNGQILVSELNETVNETVRKSLLQPESIVDDINKDNEVSKQIDGSLMSLNADQQKIVDRATELSNANQ